MLKINKRTIIHSSLFFALFLFSYACVNSSLKSIPDEAIIVCGDSKVLLVDYPENNDSVPTIVWSWDAQLANDLPFEYRTRRFNSIDDCKPTPDGKQVMVSSSSGAIAIVGIKDKKVTFRQTCPTRIQSRCCRGIKLRRLLQPPRMGIKLCYLKTLSLKSYSIQIACTPLTAWCGIANETFCTRWDTMC